MKKNKVYLTLQNGDVFVGERFGACGTAQGELVFTTGMVGYVETLTDPTNFGKIVVQTFPLIGNYGVMPADAESDKAQVSAYIVREVCETPSNFRCECTLDEYLKKEGVVAVSGVDTRQLTKILREQGAMNARISDKPLTKEEIASLANISVKNAVEAVAPKTGFTLANDDAEYTVAVWNFGAKKSALNAFVARGCKVISLPATATAEEVLATGANGVVISDGPGDPKENAASVAEVKKLLGKKPVFAVGLGHQLVALALGGDTVKDKYGHRGSNQPVKCLESGRVYVSTQNHGYSVAADGVKAGKVSFVNVNDGGCEGFDFDEYNAFTIQFTPESCDSGNVENPVYKKFFAMMQKEKENA